jgi:hypothetical protein
VIQKLSHPPFEGGELKVFHAHDHWNAYHLEKNYA